ncbi:MAG: hypothetical protein QJR10_14760 [Bacillota bacterium]|nr:hypothetical protein [Bacillota bacterium]
MLKGIEISANLGIIIVSGLIIWALFGYKLINQEPKNIEGSVVSDLPGYNWSNSQETLVIAIRSCCRFCEESLLFYKNLTVLEKRRQLKAHLVTVMPDNSLVGQAMLKSADISMDGIYSEPLDKLNVTATPTILLVDNRGRVMREWIGELTPQRENDVISAARK